MLERCSCPRVMFTRDNVSKVLVSQDSVYHRQCEKDVRIPGYCLPETMLERYLCDRILSTRDNA